MELMTEIQMCEFFGITPKLAESWRRMKRVPYSRIGHEFFYDRAELEKVLDMRKVAMDEAKAISDLVITDSQLSSIEKQRVAIGAKTVVDLFYRLSEPYIKDYLTSREFEILQRVFLEFKTYDVIGLEFDLTRERVRQIYEKAVRRMRGLLYRMAKEYGENHLGVMEENKRLSERNAILEKKFKQLTPEEKESVDEDMQASKSLSIKIIDCDLSVRALNCLKAADVDTLGDLVSYSKSDLLCFRNFGRKSLGELEQLVWSKGLRFGMNVENIKTQ